MSSRVGRTGDGAAAGLLLRALVGPMTAGLVQTTESTRANPREQSFRPDVEGMRAIAVGLVLLFHAGLPFVPGGFVGVDVFFVISGFLITGMLVREVQRTGRVSLSRFYARRAKRLLPAAALVLVTTAVLTRVVMSVVDWRVYGGDIVSAAVYLVNWRLADRSVDYLAEDVGASPVQHFWSLAVEEQFYIIWPLLLILVAWWVRRRGWSVRRTMALALALVAAPSLAWSVVMTTTDSQRAFFVTTTRLWELAVGAAVAIAAPRLARMARPAAVAVAWAGLAAVVGAGLFLTSATPWPGYAALLPTLGTAAVIAAGVAAGPRGPVAILGRAPFLWVGKLSYSLYLWHWPLIVLATAYWGDLSTKRGVAVVAVSVIPAWLAFRLVENPARHAQVMSRRARPALAIGAALSVVGAAAGLGLVASTPSAPDNEESVARGAAVLAADPEGDPAGAPVDTVDAIVPAPADAPADVPVAYDRDCQVRPESAEPIPCEWGDPNGDTVVAVVGDSKALQWISAVDIVAQEQGWRVVTHTKSACSFADATITLQGEAYQSCSEWNRHVTELLLADPPDVVVTSQGRSIALNDPDDLDSGQSDDAMVDGLVSRWSELEDAGIDVIALADSPQPGMNVYECVAENMSSLSTCAFPRDEAVKDSAADTQSVAVGQADGVDWVDITAAVCPTEACAPVIGNVLVYRQGSHLTRTYIETLAPRLGDALTPLVSESRDGG